MEEKRKKKSCTGENMQRIQPCPQCSSSPFLVSECPHREGPRAGAWMWPCSIPTRSTEHPGAEDGPPWHLPQTPECCGAGHEHPCWELAGLNSLDSFGVYSPVVHPQAIKSVA